MERQTLLSRYSNPDTVRAVLRSIFPTYKYPEFFRNNPKGFDITVRTCPNKFEAIISTNAS